MANGIVPSDINLDGVPSWVWLILLLVGILLCFFGEYIWEFMVSILGAIIGSMIGFAIGFALAGYLCAFGLAFLFAIIGSMLFQFLAKVAVALLCGLLAFGGIAYLIYSTNRDDMTTPVIVGLIVGVIVFAIALAYVEEIVGVFLAAIGGFLAGVAVYFLVEGDTALIYAVLAGGSLFIFGAIFQVMSQRARKGPRRAPPRREPVREARPKTPAQKRPPSSPEPRPQTPPQKQPPPVYEPPPPSPPYQPPPP